MKKTPVFINGDGEQIMDFTFIENEVQINIKVILTEKRSPE